MKKKRLLIVAHHLTIGGAQKSLIAALKAIDYEKFDVTLYLRKNRTDLLSFVDKRVNVIINDDKTHYYRKPYAIWLQLLIFIFKLLHMTERAECYNKKLTDILLKYAMDYEQKRFFNTQRYDIAIAYVQGYTALFVAERVNADKKFVFFHTSTDELHSVHEKIMPEFNGILVEHDSQEQLIKEWYPEKADKIHIIENYVDSETIIQQSKSEVVDVPDGKTILCYCGRITKVKGFDMAVETARILKEKNISFLWLFVGDGPDRQAIEQLVKKYGLEENIRITGMKKNPYPYIAACDIFVQSSYEENTGITILEAHRLCRPVVSTKTLGGTKLIRPRENGLLADINAEALAECIITLINDSKLSEDIVNNLKAEDYTDEFEKHKSAWQKLLEE